MSARCSKSQSGLVSVSAWTGRDLYSHRRQTITQGADDRIDVIQPRVSPA